MNNTNLWVSRNQKCLFMTDTNGPIEEVNTVSLLQCSETDPVGECPKEDFVATDPIQLTPGSKVNIELDEQGDANIEVQWKEKPLEEGKFYKVHGVEHTEVIKVGTRILAITDLGDEKDFTFV